MKTLLLTAFSFIAYCSSAQIGIRTASPNSKLHVLGSFATKYRAFTASTTATATDNLLVFTGSTAESIGLPAAAGITGRSYMIKNASTNLPTSTLTIVPSASESIEGLSSWILDAADESVTLISNGTNWYISLQNISVVPGIHWNQNGNNVISESPVGTISDVHLPFIANNVERMRLTNTGNFGIGATAFDALNAEKMFVDAGVTTSYNVISGRGNYDNYLQLNIQNTSTGNLASSDVVASNNTGTEVVNYVDMGINSSTFSNPAYPILDGANNAYLYSTGNDFIIGNGTANKNLSFFAGGSSASNEWLHLDPTGLVGVSHIAPTEKLQVEGNLKLSGLNRSLFFDATGDPYSGIKNISRSGEVNELMVFAGNESVATFSDRIRLATHEIHFATSSADGTITSGDPTSYYQSTTDVPTRMVINQNGNVAIGTTTFNTMQPEQFLVDAGVTSSYNVISGRGSINNYLQLNIQNTSNGASASSDIVATADNGDENVNFVNLGINGDGYVGPNITGGANNAYLFTTGNDFVIGTSTDNKNLLFFTTTGGVSTQRMRITTAGLLAGQDNVYSMGNTSTKFSEIWTVAGSIQTSDRRLKKNILPLTYGLKEVMLLHPVGYNWLDEKNKQNKIGLVAQEVRKIIPEVVSGNEETESIGMNYAEMIPVLINAIKELKNKVDALKIKAKELNN